MRVTEKINLYNCDNMEFMKNIPDNYYDLAIVDPPYGIGESKKQRNNNKSEKWKNPKNEIKYAKKEWDINIPNKEYFDELFRVSKNQIIWGGNYMVEFLPPSMGWIFWDKKNGGSDFSDGELAFTSFNKALRKFDWMWGGFFKQQPETRIHPTQKPVALYKWLLEKYAKQGDKIFDSHLGSMSIAIACHDYGFELDGCELDTEYYNKGIQRVKSHISQLNLF
jgi:site-specific DNA-methyltransferase (adenine-specific)